MSQDMFELRMIDEIEEPQKDLFDQYLEESEGTYFPSSDSSHNNFTPI